MLKHPPFKTLVRNALESTSYLALGTSDSRGGVWVNPVYFAFDKQVNLYFLSRLSSKHVKNIRRNPRVSVAVYSTDQPKDQRVGGLFVQGRAALVTDALVPTAYKIMYARRFPQTGVSHHPPSYYQGKRAEWRFVKITPTRLHYFDERYFGDERVPIPKVRL